MGTIERIVLNNLEDVENPIFFYQESNTKLKDIESFLARMRAQGYEFIRVSKEQMYRCKCGEVILKYNIEYRNSATEVGEDFFEINYECSSCGHIEEYQDWGYDEENNSAQILHNLFHPV